MIFFSPISFPLLPAQDSAVSPSALKLTQYVTHIAVSAFRNPAQNTANALPKVTQEASSFQKNAQPLAKEFEKPPTTGPARSSKSQRDETSTKEKQAFGTGVMSMRIFKGIACEPIKKSADKKNLVKTHSVNTSLAKTHLANPKPSSKAQKNFEKAFLQTLFKGAAGKKLLKLEKTDVVQSSKSTLAENSQRRKSLLFLKAKTEQEGRKLFKVEQSSLYQRPLQGSSLAMPSRPASAACANQKKDQVPLVRASDQAEKLPPSLANRGSAPLKMSTKSDRQGDKAKEKIRVASRKSLKKAPLRQNTSTLEKKNVAQKGAGSLNIGDVGKFSMLLAFPFLSIGDGRKQKDKSAATKEALSPRYKIADLFFLILAALLAGAKTVVEVVRFLEKKRTWVAAVLGVSDKQMVVPSQKMIWSLMLLIDADAFDTHTLFWLNEVRGSAAKFCSKGTAKPLLPHLYLWETASGVIIGQPRSEGSSLDSDFSQFLPGLLQCKGLIAMASGFEAHQNLIRGMQKRGACLLAETSCQALPQEMETFEESNQLYRTTVHVSTYNEKSTQCLLFVEHEVAGKEIKPHYYLSCGLKEPYRPFLELFPMQLCVLKDVHWIIQLAPQSDSLQVAFKNGNQNWLYFRQYAQDTLDSHIDGNLSCQEKMKKCASDEKYLLNLLAKHFCAVQMDFSKSQKEC